MGFVVDVGQDLVKVGVSGKFLAWEWDFLKFGGFAVCFVLLD